MQKPIEQAQAKPVQTLALVPRPRRKRIALGPPPLQPPLHLLPEPPRKGAGVDLHNFVGKHIDRIEKGGRNRRSVNR
jgi:hypothetical protein